MPLAFVDGGMALDERLPSYPDPFLKAPSLY